MTSNPDTTILLIGLWAAMAAACKVKGIMYRRAKVQTVRKEFIGHGNLKSDEAKRRVFEMCRLLGWNPPDRDASDAGAMWWCWSVRLSPMIAPVITPMMQQKVATTIGGIDIGDAAALFKRRARRVVEGVVT